MLPRAIRGPLKDVTTANPGRRTLTILNQQEGQVDTLDKLRWVVSQADDPQLARECDALLAQLELNAARYRWLRDVARWPSDAECGTRAGSQLDALCDEGLRSMARLDQ